MASFVQGPHEIPEYQELLDDDYSSHTTTDFSSESFHSQKAGRHQCPETPMLNGFTTVRNKKQVKKENLRVAIYRGFLGCLRCLRVKKATMTGRINRKFPKFDEVHYQIMLSDLKTYYLQHQDSIDPLLVSPQDLGMRSYNSHFFAALCRESTLRLCMQKYIDFVFFDVRPKVMEQRLYMVCCPAKEHWTECEEKWGAMKRFCQEQLFSFD